MGSAVGLGLPYLLNVSEGEMYTIGLLVGGMPGSAASIELTSGLDFVGDDAPAASLYFDAAGPLANAAPTSGATSEGGAAGPSLTSSPGWRAGVRVRFH